MARQTKAQQRAEKAQAAAEKKRKEARQRMLVGVGGTAAGLLILVLFVISIWPAPDEGDTTAESWDLPALAEEDGRVALADFRGKPTVVAFYASWCEVCEEEIPQLLALSADIGDEVNFVAINSQDNGRGMGDAEKWGIAGAWPIARDIGNGNGSALSTGTFGMRGMPLNLIYDGNGTLVHVQPGGLGASEAVALLDELTEFEV